MSKHTITFRMEDVKTRALDSIASSVDRDRSYIINEAIDTYLDIHRWQVEHIREGLRQAQTGQFASEREVAAAFKKWRT